MITYNTNWMGPINSQWIEEYGNYWAAGRIDIYDVPDEYFPIEYGLPPMHNRDFNDFSVWLDELETEELLSFDELITQFEQTAGKKIRWWEKNA